jgi:hypothetical protein
VRPALKKGAQKIKNAMKSSRNDCRTKDFLTHASKKLTDRKNAVKKSNY